MNIIKKILGVILCLVGVAFLALLIEEQPITINNIFNTMIGEIGILALAFGVIVYLGIICWLFFGDDKSDDQML